MPIAQACFVLDRVRSAHVGFERIDAFGRGKAPPTQDVPCASRHVEAALSGGLHVMRRVYRLYAAVRRNACCECSKACAQACCAWASYCCAYVVSVLDLFVMGSLDAHLGPSGQGGGSNRGGGRGVLSAPSGPISGAERGGGYRWVTLPWRPRQLVSRGG